MGYQPVELVSRQMMFMPEDLIEHRLTSDGRKVKFEHLAALNDLLEELKKYIYLEQRDDMNSVTRGYIQRLHLWVVPPEQIQIPVYDRMPKQPVTASMLDKMIVKQQFLKGGI